MEETCLKCSKWTSISYIDWPFILSFLESPTVCQFYSREYHWWYGPELTCCDWAYIYIYILHTYIRIYIHVYITVYLACSTCKSPAEHCEAVFHGVPVQLPKLVNRALQNADMERISSLLGRERSAKFRRVDVAPFHLGLEHGVSIVKPC